MAKLKTFAPADLMKDAEASGFLQCPTCGLVWFGMEDCPNLCSENTPPVHVAILCRHCDKAVPLHLFALHLVTTKHDFGENYGRKDSLSTLKRMAGWHARRGSQMDFADFRARRFLPVPSIATERPNQPAIVEFRRAYLP